MSGGHVPNSKLQRILVHWIKQTEFFSAFGFAEGWNRPAARSARLVATKRSADRERMNDQIPDHRLRRRYTVGIGHDP